MSPIPLREVVFVYIHACMTLLFSVCCGHDMIVIHSIYIYIVCVCVCVCVCSVLRLLKSTGVRWCS